MRLHGGQLQVAVLRNGVGRSGGGSGSFIAIAAPAWPLASAFAAAVAVMEQRRLLVGTAAWGRWAHMML